MVSKTGENITMLDVDKIRGEWAKGAKVTIRM